MNNKKRTIKADRICFAEKGKGAQIIADDKLYLTTPVVATWRSLFTGRITIETQNSYYVYNPMA